MRPPSVSRVENVTSEAIDRRMDAETEHSLHYHAEFPREIDRRLRELDREWNLEQVLEVKAATFALAGTVLGAVVDRRFLAMPVVAAAFLLQQALLGWCPALPLLRRLGIRSAAEIDRERYALKALRGDFRLCDPGLGGALPDQRARAAVLATAPTSLGGS